MIKPGFFVVIKSIVLESDLGAKSYLTRGNWVITNGVVLGIFDKISDLDWKPLQWGGGRTVTLDERLSNEVAAVCHPVTFQNLEKAYHKILVVEEGDLTPDMPRPKITQGLGLYLHTRRKL